MPHAETKEEVDSLVRTSQSDPLRIDEVAIDGISGLMGLTFCPGKIQKGALSGPWERDLKVDLEAIRAWGAEAWVNLLARDEMARMGVGDMKEVVENSGAGIRYFHLPIEDTSVPDPKFEEQWEDAGREVRDILVNGGKVLIHCKGGLGRSGTIAARLLVELGVEPDAAIRRVRQARPGAIENALQESHVRSVRCMRNMLRGMEIPERDLLQVQELFHGLIRSRAREGGIPVPPKLPELAITSQSTSEDGEWFPVPGMYGGFSYRFEMEGELRLIASSWCRVAGGSGRRHAITTKEILLLEEGFV
jgi:hypothetical protein